MGLGLALIASAGIGALGSIFGSSKQSKSIDRAAQLQAEAAKMAAQVQWDMYEQTREDYAPYRELGSAALPYLQYMTTGQAPEGVNAGAFDELITNNPSFRARERAINRAAAARGGYRGSAVLDRIGEAANLEADRVYGRLIDAVNIGRGAQTQTSAAGLTTAGRVGNIYGNEASNAANFQLMQGQNKASLYSQLGSLPLNLYSTYLTSQGYGGYGTGGVNPYAATYVSPYEAPYSVPFNTSGGQTPAWGQ